MLRGIPRERIPWFPTIDASRCEGCGTCVSFCRNGVYVLKENSGKAEVARPYNCVVGCSACMPQCKNEAISFPSRQEFGKVLKRLIAECRG